MYCNYCGKVIQDDANHCAYCGTRIGGVEARKRLVRPRGDRKIAGVCAGFAEYFDLDVTLVRLVWLITAVMTGVGVLSYPILGECSAPWWANVYSPPALFPHLRVCL